ncbi:bacterioferritin-associated ferredoxin [Gilvimarinus sp. F26214L]|uniref:bacterioferritin-associated ferredoxin n=1 Tax=Gilvimarinus sp. DZF01 TaxID=3461371 RepID=UPI004046670B
MYVCLCNGITDREIKASVHEGSASMEDLQENLGVSSQCGQCACLAREILEETVSELNEAALLPYAAA